MRYLLSFWLCALALAGNLCAAGQPGDTLKTTHDSYTLVEELGQGAFGTVFRAQTAQGDAVAVKVFHADARFSAFEITGSWPGEEEPDKAWPIDPIYIAEEEWLKGQLFDQPHIVRLLDRGTLLDEQGDQLPFIVMEYVDGQALKDVAEGSLTDEEALQAAIQYLEALRYLLSQNYVYIDLHPGNAMVDKWHNVKIVDLGGIYPIPLQADERRAQLYGFNAYLKKVYWVTKELLKRGQYGQQELKAIGRELKAPVGQVGQAQLTTDTRQQLSQLLELWQEALQRRLPEQRQAA